jgi:PDZ domain
MTTCSPHLALAAAALLLAGSAAAQENEERKVEKRIIVIGGDEDGDHLRLLDRLDRLADSDVDCHEEDGKKICIAKMGPGHGFGFAGQGLGFVGTFLGVELTDSTPELREHLGGPRDAGVLISRVEDSSPAAQAGIEVGDIVTSVDGEAVESARDLRHAIASREAGDAVTIELYRDGKAEQVTATLAKREPRMFTKRLELPHGMRFDSEELSEQIHQALEGIDLEDLDEKVRKQLDSIDWDEIRETVREALDRALERHPGEREEK